MSSEHNTAIILLAAGLSRRTGTFKMALPLGNETVLERTFRIAKSVADRVIVVTGNNRERIEELDLPGVELIHNAGYEGGMFTSVRTGIAALDSEDFFIMPGDFPLVEQDVYIRMLEAFTQNGSNRIVMPTFEGRTGHPVLIPGTSAQEILNMPETATLRDFVYPANPIRVEVSTDAIFRDIDYIEDYHKIEEMLR